MSAQHTPGSRPDDFEGFDALSDYLHAQHKRGPWIVYHAASPLDMVFYVGGDGGDTCHRALARRFTDKEAADKEASVWRELGWHAVVVAEDRAAIAKATGSAS